MSESYMMILVTAAGVAVPPSSAPAPAVQGPAAQETPATQAPSSVPKYDRRTYTDPAECERAAAGVALPPGLRLVCVPIGAVRLLEAPAF